MRYKRLFFYPVVLVLLTLALLACGSADESVQRELGNLPDAPTSAPQVATPPEAVLSGQPTGASQDGDATATPEPTFTPLPTFCVPWPTQFDGGENDTMCVHPKQYPTPVYTNMTEDLSRTAEAADRDAESVTRSAGEEAEWVRIMVFPHSADQASAIVTWLDGNDYRHDIINKDTSYSHVRTHVRASDLGELSELPAVKDMIRIHEAVITPTLPIP